MREGGEERRPEKAKGSGTRTSHDRQIAVLDDAKRFLVTKERKR